MSLRKSAKLFFKPINPQTTLIPTNHYVWFKSAQSLWNRFNRVFLTYPLIAGSLFSGIKTQTADLFAQIKLEQTNYNELDWRRNLLFFLFGSMHCGFITYVILVKGYAHVFSMTRLGLLSKVLFDVLITTPVVYFPSFYTFKCFVYEGDSFGYDKWKEYQTTYWTQNIKKDVTASASIWAPTHLITFTLIPNHLKLVWIGCVSMVWTVILSTMRGSNVEQDTVSTHYGTNTN